METKRSEVDLETVVRRIRDEELDLQPEFQRGEVWDLPRRQRLIDSILRDWYVPAVHFVRDEDGEETVLDGQQRLAAIRDFFDGRFRVNGKIEPLDDSISDLDGLKFDLRIYVLLMGVDPLKVFLFKDGLTRLATEPYKGT